MAKTHINISVDNEIIEKIRLMEINISGEVNNFLRLLIMEKTEDLDEVNLLKLEEEQKELQEELREKQLRNKIIYDKIKLIKEKKKQKRIQEFEKQKKRVQELQKCFICGQEIKSFENKE